VVSARTWYPDATVDLVTPGVEDMNPTFHDLYGKAQMDLGEGTVVSGNLLLSGDNIDFTGDGHAQVAEARSASRYAWLTVKSVLSPRLLSETMVSSGAIESNREGHLGSGPIVEAQVGDRRSFNFFALKQDVSFQGSDRHLLRGGVSAEEGAAEYDYFNQPAPSDPLFGGSSTAPAPQPRLTLQPSGYTFGAYVADRYQIAAPLTLDLGLRWDKQTYAPDRQVSPRVNLAYALGRSSTLRAGWGRFYQAQGLDELQVEDGVSRFAPAQVADHSMLGFEHYFRQGLSFRLDAYRKEMSQLRPRYENLFNPIELFPEVEPDRIRIAPQRAEARGLELSLRKERPTGISWWAGYALASAQDQIDSQWVPRSWDQTHTVNFGVNYRVADRWDLTLAGVYHSGWPTTGVTAELVSSPDGSQTLQPILGPRNAERLPAFHRLDFKVRRHLNFGRGRMSLFAEVTNLYNRDNVCCAKDFNFTPRADGSVQVDRVDGFWLQQVPVFGLEWESAP
jgi:outer membrane receptor protein involved in Fe transport